MLVGSASAALFLAALPAVAAEAAVDAAATTDAGDGDGGGEVEAVIVTARRRAEQAQDVPIALSVLSAETLDKTGTYNLAQVVQLAPSLYIGSFNPRNTTVNIRGLGNNLGLANDGLEAGVGLYIDQVYFSRPAASTFDLSDVERVEVLRGPQGTLFGKNTTAGAINVSTRLPTFTPEGRFEVSYGEYGFLQGKASIAGPITDTVAFRLSASSTQRNGLVKNVVSGRNYNNLDNTAIRGQLLFKPSDKLQVRFVADWNRQETDCCVLVYAGYGPTQKPAALQYPALIAGLNYTNPSQNPFDRLTDINDEAHANQTLGGVSAIVDYDLGFATLTSVTAWRYWDWDPANDADFSRLSILDKSQNADQQDQYSQEFRLASNGEGPISWIAGVYAFRQTIDAQGLAQYGANSAYWLLGPTQPAALLNGYQARSGASSSTNSYAAFGQLTWKVGERLSITPGLRYTYEEKDAAYIQVVSGGLANPTAAQQALKFAVARPQAYEAHNNDGKLSGQVNVAWQQTRDLLIYGNYARGYKSGGLNLSGLPLDTAGNPVLARAVIAPEKTDAWEAGFKSQLFDRRLIFNAAAFWSETQDYQANVVDTAGGALRQFLDNIPKVRSRGVEVDTRLTPINGFSAYASGAYTDAEYVSYANGPCPLELIGTVTRACDLSGRPLPGVSKLVASAGGEYRRPAHVLGLDGEAYVGAEWNWRSRFYSSASDSVYSRIGSYGLLNLRAGFKAENRWEAFAWVRNAGDKKYFQYISGLLGNTGALNGAPGDPRTVGVTLKASY
ncbi:MAG: TonB-dependent receptor [Alphaproteobacteria bacterium]|nr:TonB-dependent receptor [Alphaproteobacteria bacterium]MBU2096314.1 TonB-dependent receptor [Alphaproteobacteria bacterium]MBU2154033.1 TonB-dependent receptor [Alphaproteobacteria bacterium]MBU2362961.1 TonB-dependent receptor [Alphaproteobacteria bacterium]